MPAKRKAPKGRKWTPRELRIFDSLLEAGATQAEMARALKCTTSTLKKHFGDRLKGKQPRGRRAREYSGEERDMVALVAGLGIAWADIASMKGMSLNEFQAVFAEELQGGKARVDAAIASAIVLQGLAGDGVLLRFYARAKLGWNDRKLPDAPPADDRDAAMRKGIEDLDEKGLAAYQVVLEQLGARSPTDGPGPDDRLH